MIQNNLLKWGDYGKLTIPTLIGVGSWFVIVPFVIIAASLLVWLNRKSM